MIARPDGSISYANRAAEEILGVVGEEITRRAYNAPSWKITDLAGRTLPDEVHPFRRVMATLEPIRNMCHAIEWPDGTRKILSVNGAPLSDASGELFGIVFTVEDITLIQKAEDTLRARLKIEELLSRISLSAARSDSFSDFLRSSIEDIGRTLSLSRSTLAEFDWTDKRLLVTYQWRAEGVDDTSEVWDSIFSYETSAMLSDPGFGSAPMIFEDVEAVPVRQFVELLRSIGTRSIVIIPIVLGSHIYGILSFETVGEKRSWSPETVRLLNLGSQIFAQAIQREHAKRLLTESEEKFRSIVELSSEWIWMMGPDGAMTYNNPAIDRILGYPSGELQGRNTLQYMHNEDRRRIEKMLPGLIERKEGWKNLVVRWKRADGEYAFLESSSRPVFDRDGKFAGYLGYDRDITERVRTEEVLREHERRYNALFHGSLNLVILLDLHGRVKEVNSAALKLMECEREDFVGHGLSEFLSSQDLASAMSAIQAITVGNRTSRSSIYQMDENPLRLKARLPNGSVKDLEVTGSAVYRDGVLVEIQVLGLDITERVKAEQDLLMSKQSAEAATQRAQTYLDFIIHDLTNILSPVLTYADVISKSDEAGPKVQTYSSKIVDEMERATSFVRNTRRLSESERNEEKRREPGDLASIIGKIEKTLKVRYPPKNIDLRCSFPVEGPLLACGKEFIAEILEEVLDNATRHAISPDVRIDVTVRSVTGSGEGDFWKVEVVDYGPGIPDSLKDGLMAKAFEPEARFRRGIATSLPFMSLIAEHIDGSLRISNRVPDDHAKGTVVVLVLRKSR